MALFSAKVAEGTPVAGADASRPRSRPVIDRDEQPRYCGASFSVESATSPSRTSLGCMVKRASGKPVPGWARDPFHRFKAYIDQESQLLRLATAGISALVASEKLVTALARLDKALGDGRDSRQEVREARARARLARAEVKKGFPLLHGHSLVGVWGALETLVDDVALAWLTHRRKFLEDSDLATVRVPIATFVRMTRAERLEHLLDQVPRRPGVGGGLPRLEELLSKVGLAGPLDEDVRRTLIEAHQARNLFAHRGGVVDRKAASACPWRKDWKIGEPLPMNVREYTRMTRALDAYVAELIYRTGDRFGLDLRPEVEEAERQGPNRSRRASRRPATG